MFRLIFVFVLQLVLGISTAYAGDIKAGKKVFKKCKACHTVKPGKHKVGPSLHGVIDSAGGTSIGYQYSSALQTSGIIWDKKNLTAFLKSPKSIVPNNKMSFSGLKKDDDIANLIAYIASESE